MVGKIVIIWLDHWHILTNRIVVRSNGKIFYKYSFDFTYLSLRCLFLEVTSRNYASVAAVSEASKRTFLAACYLELIGYRCASAIMHRYAFCLSKIV